ncbi:MAG: glycosyltransferase [Gemmataceae bacterium]|nr:glycosyltransferase [Gemmataceae bacterium]
MDGDHSPVCFLSLVIPAYNEAAGIAQAIDEADAALASLGHRYEIIVVDDGSGDATAAIVAGIALRRSTVRLVRHAVNQGYGAALRTGFTAARGARIAFTDADCQFFLADLASLIQLTDQHPIAVGYRVDRQDSRLRRFYSRGYNLLARTLLGTTVRDLDCALKVFRREALAKILPASRGFFVNTEMLTRARQERLSVAEIGVRHRPRLRGHSKVSLLDVPRTLNALVPFWWSRVLFPQHERPRQPAAGWALDVLILGVMAGLLFFARLGAPLLEPEEARYAEIPRQMLAEGRVVTPVLHGEPYYHKPPLLYWLVMGCYALVGVQDWAARLVPAVAGVLTVLITYAWASRAVSRWAGFAGAAILCLSAKFLYQAGMLTFDSPLCLFVLAALACAHRALDGPALRFGWWLLGAAACGLGVLTKGPVAVALVVPPVLAWQFMERRRAPAGWQAWFGWLAVTGLVAAPWFVAIAWHDPAALGEFFWIHNLLRYVAPLDHAEPVWYFIPALVLGMLPWSLLLIPFVGYLIKRSASAGRRRPAALGFFLLSFLWIVAFFSLSGCKRTGYILPAFPFLALALGTFAASTMGRRRWAALLPARSHPAWPRWAHRVTLGAFIVAMLVTGAAAVRELIDWRSALAADLGLLAIFAILWQRGPSRVAWRGWATCGASVFVLLLMGMHQLLPDYHRAFALRGQVRRHFELVRDPDVPVASYPKRWDSVSFYLQRDNVEVYSPARRAELIRDLRQQGETMLFVKQGEALQDLLQALPDDLEFVPRGRPGRTVIGGVVQRRGR